MELYETYNLIAESWHKDHQADDWWIDGTDQFAKLIPYDSLILDVGCGGGFKSKYLLDMRRGLRVIGVDFSENLIEIARREVPKAEFRVMDMRDAHTIPEMFEGTFAQASLLHIPRDEAQAVVDALVSRLNVGGHLYVAVKGSRPGSPLEEMKEENDYGYPYQRFFSYYSPEEVENLFRTAGLVIEYRSVLPSGKTDWIQMIGQKIA